MSRANFDPGDPDARRLAEQVLSAINAIAQFVDFGDGVPAHTPSGRAIYIRRDGGAGSTLYVWEGAGWAAK